MNTASNTANSTMANFNKNLFPIEVKKNEKIYFWRGIVVKFNIFI
jgi:hypothetical protein